MSGDRTRAVVARTGVANLASVCAALKRAGLDPVCTDDPAEFEHAPLAVLPGVGSFAAGMEALRTTGLDTAILTRAACSRPLLAICLGMQLLCERSDESPGVTGLGVIPTRVIGMSGNNRVRVPQLGWNRVGAENCRIACVGFAYFANSYAAASVPTGWRGAWFEHGGRRVAAFERGGAAAGNLLACQFHPELSGPWGQALIERWVRASIGSGAMTC